MKLITKVMLAAFVSAFVAACATAPSMPTQSLRGMDAAAPDKVFAEHVWFGTRPGTHEGYTRTYSTQPPLIPHAVTNFDEVNLRENQCLECHGPTTYKKKESPPVSKTHYVGGDLKSGQVDSSRYACVMCHVQQSDAAPLVANSFKGDRLVPPALKKQ